MSAETAEQSIKDIINSVIADNSSPISSWLVNVIETYLNNSQKSEPLTINKLFALTNDMLLTYSIATSQAESKQLCLKLIQLLQVNKHLPPFHEPFPINAKCIALYIEDNEWYAAKITEIKQPGYEYAIQFEDYGNEQNTVIDQLKQCESTEKTPKQSVSLQDSIKTSTQKEKDLDKMILRDDSIANNGVKGKKYHNEMMDLYEVDEEKLARLVINDEDTKNFEIFADGKEKDDKYGEGFTESDVEKYTIIDENGKKKRIKPSNDVCCVCNRLLPLTWHHLIPKCTHNEYIKVHSDSNAKEKRLFLNKHGIWICRQCHSAIHGTFSNKELMKSYWKLPMLLETDKIQKWIKYISKQRVSRHYDKRANKRNIVAQIQTDKNDHSTKIKYIQ